MQVWILLLISLHLKTAVSTSTKDELDNVNERVTSLEKLLVKKEEQIMVLEIKSQLHWRRIYK